METFISDISNQEFPVSEKVSGTSIRNSLLTLIQQEHPKFKASGNISMSELNAYRQKYIATYLLSEIGELTNLEETVLSSIHDRKTIADKVDDIERQKLSLGQKIADKVASFGGSWKFIILFAIFIVLWIFSNVYWLLNRGFDPYPFILLNLILSCLAAIQAPVIMMSQNRQEEKDRTREKQDYMVNLKSELEIRMLHEKLDHLMLHQQQELIEIQKVQIDMMNEILERIKKE